ncbi:hypothetical protein WOLCODRAFT_143217 [Wolfiporia cocos MD-104 SS10]|uniref:C2H2-type domain-containing protein n=1 Tax=Wolfiporia cocos (strain MD-104) TaxID=742152 RepID=A0A2H3JGV2_WOLCO|nr:hypothetical protein WOLCODRAFT_143217 [Wolfiporia cocos MD-104 SS10]
MNNGQDGNQANWMQLVSVPTLVTPETYQRTQYQLQALRERISNYEQALEAGLQRYAVQEEELRNRVEEGRRAEMMLAQLQSGATPDVQSTPPLSATAPISNATPAAQPSNNAMYLQALQRMVQGRQQQGYPALPLPYTPYPQPQQHYFPQASSQQPAYRHYNPTTVPYQSQSVPSAGGSSTVGSWPSNGVPQTASSMASVPNDQGSNLSTAGVNSSTTHTAPTIPQHHSQPTFNGGNIAVQSDNASVLGSQNEHLHHPQATNSSQGGNSGVDVAGTYRDIMNKVKSLSPATVGFILTVVVKLLPEKFPPGTMNEMNIDNVKKNMPEPLWQQLQTVIRQVHGHVKNLDSHLILPLLKKIQEDVNRIAAQDPNRSRQAGSSAVRGTPATNAGQNPEALSAQPNAERRNSSQSFRPARDGAPSLARPVSESLQTVAPTAHQASPMRPMLSRTNHTAGNAPPLPRANNDPGVTNVMSATMGAQQPAMQSASVMAISSNEGQPSAMAATAALPRASPYTSLGTANQWSNLAPVPQTTPSKVGNTSSTQPPPWTPANVNKSRLAHDILRALGRPRPDSPPPVTPGTPPAVSPSLTTLPQYTTDPEPAAPIPEPVSVPHAPEPEPVPYAPEPEPEPIAHAPEPESEPVATNHEPPSSPPSLPGPGPPPSSSPPLSTGSATLKRKRVDSVASSSPELRKRRAEAAEIEEIHTDGALELAVWQRVNTENEQLMGMQGQDGAPFGVPAPDGLGAGFVAHAPGAPPAEFAIPDLLLPEFAEGHAGDVAPVEDPSPFFIPPQEAIQLEPHGAAHARSPEVIVIDDDDEPSTPPPQRAEAGPSVAKIPLFFPSPPSVHGPGADDVSELDIGAGAGADEDMEVDARGLSGVARARGDTSAGMDKGKGKGKERAGGLAVGEGPAGSGAKGRVYVLAPPQPAWVKRLAARRRGGGTRVGRGRWQGSMDVDELAGDIESDDERAKEEYARKEAVRLSASRLRELRCRWRDCGALLASAVRLKQHLAGHGQAAGVEPEWGQYKCEWQHCARRFGTQSALSHHAMTHAGSGPLLCAYADCEKTFPSGQDLLAHHRSKHGGDTLKPTANPIRHEDAGRLSPLPATLPSYMVIPRHISRYPITKELHAWLGASVLQDISAYRFYGRQLHAEARARGSRRLTERVAALQRELGDPALLQDAVRRLPDDEWQARESGHGGDGVHAPVDVDRGGGVDGGACAVPSPSHAPLPAMLAAAPTFVSAHSADVFLSDVRPIKLAFDALHAVNVLLDELLYTILHTAQSLATAKLKAALTKLLPTSLGKDALLEAEVELQAYWERTTPSTSAEAEDEPHFDLQWYYELLRLKCEAYCTLNDSDEDADAERHLKERMDERGVPFPPNATALAPAALYLTAILEAICQHVLSNVGSVATRDSSRTAATLQDVFTALCEDDTVYGTFRSMKAYEQIETLSRAQKPRRSKSISRLTDRVSSPGPSGTEYAAARESPSLPAWTRMSGESLLSGSTTAASVERGSLDSRGKVMRMLSHSRSSSDKSSSPAEIARSESGKSCDSRDFEVRLLPSAGTGSRRSQIVSQHDDDLRHEFDELMRSGATMKVSLTPDRLKSMEVHSKAQRANRRGAGQISETAGNEYAPHPAPPYVESINESEEDPALTSAPAAAPPRTRQTSKSFSARSHPSHAARTRSVSISDMPHPRHQVASAASSVAESYAVPINGSASIEGHPGPVRRQNSGGIPPRARKVIRNRESMDLDEIMAGSDEETAEGDEFPPSPRRSAPKPKPAHLSQSARELIAFLDEGPPEELTAPRPSMANASVLSFESSKSRSSRFSKMMSKLTIGTERANGRGSEDAPKTPKTPRSLTRKPSSSVLPPPPSFRRPSLSSKRSSPSVVISAPAPAPAPAPVPSGASPIISPPTSSISSPQSLVPSPSMPLSPPLPRSLSSSSQTSQDTNSRTPSPRRNGSVRKAVPVWDETPAVPLPPPPPIHPLALIPESDPSTPSRDSSLRAWTNGVPSHPYAPAPPAETQAPVRPPPGRDGSLMIKTSLGYSAGAHRLSPSPSASSRGEDDERWLARGMSRRSPVTRKPPPSPVPPDDAPPTPASLPDTVDAPRSASGAGRRKEKSGSSARRAAAAPDGAITARSVAELRRLLAAATSAEECRLLVDMFFTRHGFPLKNSLPPVDVSDFPTPPPLDETRLVSLTDLECSMVELFLGGADAESSGHAKALAMAQSLPPRETLGTPQRSLTQSTHRSLSRSIPEEPAAEEPSNAIATIRE